MRSYVLDLIAFKYHVLCTDGKVSVRINLLFYLFFHKKTTTEKNTLEEIEIQKTASSENLLNDVIAGQNDPIYKLLPSQ